MSVGQVVLHGRVLPDGTLELNQPVGLPPGEVQVTVEPVAVSAALNEDLGTLMERIGGAAGPRLPAENPRRD